MSSNNNVSSSSSSSSETLIPTVPGFVLTEKLGSGTYATVYKAHRVAERRRATRPQKGQPPEPPREVVAIKCVARGRLGRHGCDLITEISLMKELRHPHIVGLKDFLYDKQYVYLVEEYCSGGDLYQMIKAHRVLPERVCRRFLQQLALALRYLRQNGVAHMDLKPQNILLQSRERPILKLADFGFAQHLDDDTKCDYLRGSPLYMAPEMVVSRQYDARADLWSVGVILHECLFGRAPFASRSLEEVGKKLRDPGPVVLPCGLPITATCRDLLQRLLERDPDHRISFEGFFAHPFVDLDHLPSKHSLDLASRHLKEAVTEDTKGAVAAAASAYTEGLAHLMAAVKWEKDPARRHALRDRMRQYMARAEQLKTQMSKPSREEASDPSTGEGAAAEGAAEARYQELLSLCRAQPEGSLAGSAARLEAALRVASGGEFFEHRDRLDVALDKYRVALDVLLQEARHLDKDSHLRTLLYKQIDYWMRRAERLKHYERVHRETYPEDVAASSTLDDSGTSSVTAASDLSSDSGVVADTSVEGAPAVSMDSIKEAAFVRDQCVVQ